MEFCGDFNPLMGLKADRMMKNLLWSAFNASSSPEIQARNKQSLLCSSLLNEFSLYLVLVIFCIEQNFKKLQWGKSILLGFISRWNHPASIDFNLPTLVWGLYISKFEKKISMYNRVYKTHKDVNLKDSWTFLNHKLKMSPADHRSMKLFSSSSTII